MKHSQLLLLLIQMLFFPCKPISFGRKLPPPTSPLITHLDHHSQPKKEYTYCVDIEADNDLEIFAGRSIRQLQMYGSNEHINILVHLNTNFKGLNKISKIFYVERNKLIQIGPTSQKDGGNPNTVIDFVRWAAENYPSHHFCLSFWGHGTGFVDPRRPGRTDQSYLSFPMAPEMCSEEEIGLVDWITSTEQLLSIRQQRGISFDETTGNYLTNAKLHYALSKITAILGKKIDVIFFDACHMQMWEVLRMIAPFANYVVGSQDVELGPGHNYAFLLEPFRTMIPTPYELACHAVRSYERSYSRITNTYTQSAVVLDNITLLDESINKLADILTEGLAKQHKGSVKEVIRKCRNKLVCTQYKDPSYIDLCSFLDNLQKNGKSILLKNAHETKNFSTKLANSIDTIKKAVSNVVIAQCHGKNLPSGGISIYFPENVIHPACYNVPGTKTNRWLRFISRYLGI